MANITTNVENNANITEETSSFVLGVGIIFASLVGVWGVTCLVSALNSVGLVNLAKGFLTATGM